MPRAKITHIDTSKAKKLPGVKAVITADDAANIMVAANRPVFCQDVANYVGEEIAAVAAVDELTAQEALELIEVVYEPLPAATTLRQALKPDAPQIHGQSPGNIALNIENDMGDPDETFAKAGRTFSDEFGNHTTHNVLSEFHVAVADFTRPDKLSMWTPLQSAPNFQDMFAAAFKLKQSQIRMVHLNTGGAFTGRGTPRPHHFISAMLSRKTGRPCKVRAAGDEEFTVFPASGENMFKFKTAVDEDGTIKGIDVDIMTECGAHAAAQAMLAFIPGNYVNWLYEVEAVRFHGQVVYTNNAPYFYHHGGIMGQMSAGWMQHLTRVAENIGMDPLAFHIKNAVKKDHTCMDGTYFGSCGLIECLEKVRDQSGWNEKYGKASAL